ncbi:MAG: NifU family protein [Sphingomonadales bacterium]|nr:NifU family protein [Sphingomonadales bacterium]MBM3923448.1 NifU family protein [Sphingomonadales bacterium]
MSQVEPIQVFAESTPNPTVIKLITNRALLPGHLLEINRSNDLGLSPLGSRLLEFEEIVSVMISNSFVSLTRQPYAEWSDLTAVLRDFMIHYLQSDLPLVDKALWEIHGSSLAIDASSNVVTRLENDVDESLANDPVGVSFQRNPQIESKIEEILKDYIQPAVEQDGGAIQFKSFNPESGLVKVVLRGACNGCPSASLTLKAGIENLLRRMVPEVKEVVAD